MSYLVQTLKTGFLVTRLELEVITSQKIFMAILVSHILWWQTILTFSPIINWYKLVDYKVMLEHLRYFEIWAMSWHNLLLLYANNKGTDQPAHSSSLISAFVVHCLGSIKPKLAKSKISRLQLFSVAEQAGLSLTWSKTPKTGFLMTRLNKFILCVPASGN